MREKDIDIEAIDRRATDLAESISRTMAKPGILSMHDSIIALITGVCKVIQLMSMIMGANAKVMAQLFIDGINKYFENGGDQYLTNFYRAMNAKKKDFN